MSQPRLTSVPPPPDDIRSRLTSTENAVADALVEMQERETRLLSDRRPQERKRSAPAGSRGRVGARVASVGLANDHHHRNGGQTNMKMNYRLWIDGVEIPNASLTGGPSAGGVASSTLMNYQSAWNFPPGAKMSKAFVLSSDLGLVASGDQALIDPMQAYLVAA